MLPPPGLSSASGKPVVVKLDVAACTCRMAAFRVARSRTSGFLSRRSARRLHDRSSRGRSDHAQLGGRGVICFRLLMISAGFTRTAANRDANACCAAIRYSRWRWIFHPSIGSCARSRQYRGLSNLPDVRAVLRMGRAMVDLYYPSPLRHGSQTDHAGHRRHVRCGPRWSAVAAVQRPLRRIRISADRRVRRRRPLRHRRASSRQAAERQGDQALPEAEPVARDPRSLA